MKALGLVVVALGGAISLSFVVCEIAGLFLTRDVAMPVSMAISFVIGFNSRRAAEKILGYTLQDALKGEDNE